MIFKRFTAQIVVVGGICMIVLIFTVTTILRSSSSPTVTFEDGAVQGSIAYSRNGTQYFEYKGIPFAEPPVGQFRFQPPVPVKPWLGVKQVRKYPPSCVQFDILRLRVTGVEDCLYLNVFSQSVKPKAGKAVMIFIHGGAFIAGSSQMYGPKYFMDENIVLVSINYRLGPLGFLNTGDELVRGNMGLKDQNLALRWVQRNIHKFGGDPSRVTIFGESAGSASVSYHVISKASRGLFHKAIQQSAAVFSPWTLTRKPREVAIKYAKYLNCPTENSSVMVACLNKTDVETLVQPQSLILIPTSDEVDIFVPSVETVIREDTFLSEDPIYLLETGDFSRVPLIIGMTSGEGAILTARFEAMPELVPNLDVNWTSVLPRVLGYNKSLEFASQQIREFYFSSQKPFADDMSEFKKNFTTLISDALFFQPMYRNAISHAKHGAPTYLYYYDYDSVSLPSVYSFRRSARLDDWFPAEIKIFADVTLDSISKRLFGSGESHELGSCHADDLFQLFNMVWIIDSFSSNDLPFSQKFVKLFVDFARNESLQFNGVSWPPVSVDSQSIEHPAVKYMLINKDGKVIPEPFADRIRFWESLNIRD